MFSLKGATGIDSDDFSICMGKKKKSKLYLILLTQDNLPHLHLKPMLTILQHFFFPT